MKPIVLDLLPLISLLTVIISFLYSIVCFFASKIPIFPIKDLAVTLFVVIKIFEILFRITEDDVRIKTSLYFQWHWNRKFQSPSYSANSSNSWDRGDIFNLHQPWGAPAVFKFRSNGTLFSQNTAIQEGLHSSFRLGKASVEIFFCMVAFIWQNNSSRLPQCFCIRYYGFNETL